MNATVDEKCVTTRHFLKFQSVDHVIDALELYVCLDLLDKSSLRRSNLQKNPSVHHYILVEKLALPQNS